MTPHLDGVGEDITSVVYFESYVEKQKYAGQAQYTIAISACREKVIGRERQRQRKRGGRQKERHTEGDKRERAHERERE